MKRKRERESEWVMKSAAILERSDRGYAPKPRSSCLQSTQLILKSRKGSTSSNQRQEPFQIRLVHGAYAREVTDGDQMSFQFVPIPQVQGQSL